MSAAIKLRYGTTIEHSTSIGAPREISIDTTKNTAVVHDGLTAGGFPLASESQLSNYLPLSGGSMSGAVNQAAGSSIASASTVNLTSATGNFLHITGSTTINSITLATGAERVVVFDGILQLTNGANLILPTAANITTAVNDVAVFRGEPSGVVRCVSYTRYSGTSLAAQAAVDIVPPVRQTVLSGPVDVNGLPSFGGVTGTTTVTASGTIMATAAAGGNSNRTGTITNPSWTGLSTNGTMYLYLDIDSAGVVTTGSATLAPIYRFGGADIVTNGQNTFNIQEMTMKAGNGSAATQVYRVFVGEVTVSGGIVTSIVWYALMGRYISDWVNTLPAAGAIISSSHNIGTDIFVGEIELKCLTAEFGFSVGDIESGFANWITGSGNIGLNMRKRPLIATVATASGGWQGQNMSTATAVIFTPANWAYRFIAQRRF